MYYRKDEPIHIGKRRNMVSNIRNMLKAKGFENNNVLQAFMNVPRHFFFDSVFDAKYSYENIAFPIGVGQTISKPFSVAFQTILLDVKKGEKILEIGTGSGYQCAILCELKAQVFSIERHSILYENAKKILSYMKYNPTLYLGDGYLGKKIYAPFDKIIVTCGAPFIPKALIEQLKVGGIMIIPVGDELNQKMMKITKISDDKFNSESHGDFCFVPMLKDIDKNKKS